MHLIGHVFERLNMLCYLLKQSLLLGIRSLPRHFDWHTAPQCHRSYATVFHAEFPNGYNYSLLSKHHPLASPRPAPLVDSTHV